MTQFVNSLQQSARGKIADLLVFGFIRSEIKLIPKHCDVNFPDDIIIECLKFYFLNHVWDPNAYPKDRMELVSDNNSVRSISSLGYSSAYCLNVLQKPDVYRYQFKILQSWGSASVWSQTFGIWKVNENNDPPLCNDFCLAEQESMAISNKPEVVFEGRQTLRYNDCPSIVTGDIVEMIVDFETEELRFKVNGKDYGKASDINSDYRYRAAVSLTYQDEAIQLL